MTNTPTSVSPAARAEEPVPLDAHNKGWLIGEVEQLRASVAALVRERDEARREVEKWREIGGPQRTVTVLRAIAKGPAELLALPITGKFAAGYLSVRTASNLANRFRLAAEHPGAPTIGEILAASDDDLLRTPCIGPVAVEEVHRLRAALTGGPSHAP